MTNIILCGGSGTRRRTFTKILSIEVCILPRCVQKAGAFVCIAIERFDLASITKRFKDERQEFIKCFEV